MLRVRLRPNKLIAGIASVALLSTGLGVGLGTVAATPAVADTAPTDAGVPQTVSSDALPTVQINGIVWAQAIAGNRVYVTGQFTQARPAGAAAGQNQTPRSNILAYDLTTGALIQDWAPTLNGQGRAITTSADGSVVYVGGDFSQVNGSGRTRLAAISASTGALVSNWNPAPNNRVTALAVDGTTLYIGGYFTQLGTTPRSRLAAINRTNATLIDWTPSPDRDVAAIVTLPALNRVVIGGSFATVNGNAQPGMTSIDMTTGQLRPWAVNQIIRNSGEGSYISGLVTDGNRVFGSAWNYGGGGGVGNFEGVFGADPATGALVWVDGCRGDRYGIALSGDAVYTGGHFHDCGMVEDFPQFDPWEYQMAQAMDKNASPNGLTNTFGTNGNWTHFPGRPASEVLHWMPDLALGSYTGLYQASWTVAGNDDYVVYGGEFPRVNGIGQQGLVRFARRGIAPNTDAVQGFTQLTPTVTSAGPGSVRVAWTGAFDRDNEQLTVEVLRGATTASSTVLKTFTTRTNWWTRPPLAFVDSTAPPGSSQTYRIRVRDAFGNGFASNPTTATIPAGSPIASTYANAVLADSPSYQWRLDEPTGTTASDRSGSNDLALNAATQRDVPGALLNETNAAVNFPGTTSTSTVPGATPFFQSGPQTFTLETWVRTNTTNGGKILGFGDSRTGRSDTNNNDRVLYMTNAGQIRFGVRPDMGTRTTVNSPLNYRDNQWHHVVGTLGADGLKLYIDGALVASNASVTKAQVYWGYWRLGGDRLSNWPSVPTREAITANIDETAIYPKALTLQQIRSHYEASGRGGLANVPPIASFTSSVNFQDVSFTSTSTDPDGGSIVSHAWTFGDGGTSTATNPNHTYTTAGPHVVSLTVTDNNTGTNTTTQTVITSNPPANVPPVASFTAAVTNQDVAFTDTSTDPDGGTIVSHLWDFGDGNTSTATNPNHTYTTAGPHVVFLTVTDDDNGSTTTNQTVTTNDPPPNVPPIASFTAAVTNQDVAFTDTSTDPDGGTIVSHLWDFGDGNTSTATNPNHTYTTAGPHVVFLTVTDDDNGSTTTNQTVTTNDPPPNVPPIASFTAAVNVLSVGFTSTSTDPDGGTITGYFWDFGDGATSTATNPTHVYATGGPYVVALTVTDDDLGTNTATQTVTAINPPPEFALDTFTRTVANGLGTANIGGVWTLSGAATSFSVGPVAARIAGVTNANRGGFLTAVGQTNVDMSADLSINTASNGGGAYQSIIGRRVSNGNDYRLKVRYMPNGVPIIYLVRTLGGVETLLAWTNVNGITVSPGDVLSTRFQVIGNNPTTVRAKVWRQGTTEPTAWLLTGSDAATPAALQAPGHVGFLFYISSTWVGTAPVLTMDNFRVGPLP